MPFSNSLTPHHFILHVENRICVLSIVASIATRARTILRTSLVVSIDLWGTKILIIRLRVVVCSFAHLFYFAAG
jgi:hypothetical protein